MRGLVNLKLKSNQILGNLNSNRVTLTMLLCNALYMHHVFSLLIVTRCIIKICIFLAASKTGCLSCFNVLYFINELFVRSYYTSHTLHYKVRYKTNLMHLKYLHNTYRKALSKLLEMLLWHLTRIQYVKVIKLLNE